MYNKIVKSEQIFNKKTIVSVYLELGPLNSTNTSDSVSPSGPAAEV